MLTEDYDYGNNYAVNPGNSNTFGNSVFVVPTSGLYHFDAALGLRETENDHPIHYPELRLVIIRGGRIVVGAIEFSPLIRYEGLSEFMIHAELSKDVQLMTNDIVFLEVYHSSDVAVQLFQSGSKPFFSGHLVFEN